MRRTFLISLFALSFCACKKNSDNTQPKNSNKHLLVASVINDYSNGTYETDYTYDNQNRLITNHTFTTGNANGDNATHVYKYDSEGNLIKSTITRGGDISIFDYTYINGAPTNVAYSQPGNPSQGHTIAITTGNSQVTGNNINTPSGESATVNYSYNDNNKVNEVNNAFSISGNLEYILTISDEYGKKRNPYLYSGYKWVLPDVPFANSNDLLKETGSSNGSTLVTTYANTYNDQGYPVTVKASEASATKTTQYTITYKYIEAK